MSPHVRRLLDLAAREVGTAEHPAGSNRQPYAALAHHANGQPWCATFVVAMLRSAGYTIPADVAVASSRTMFANARRHGYAVELLDVEPGDVVHMTRGLLRRWLGHVAIATSTPRLVAGVWVLDTIEGNTDGKGSATGGAVLRHTRPLKAWNLGAWRPPFTTTSTTKGSNE